MVALGVYALGMKRSKLWVAIVIKALGAIARPCRCPVPPPR